MKNIQRYDAYVAALSNGKDVTHFLKYLRLLFVGPPGSGKSTMRQRLLRLIENITASKTLSLSTSLEMYEVMCNATVAITSSESNTQWSLITKKPGLPNIYEDEKEDILKLFRLLCTHDQSHTDKAELVPVTNYPNSTAVTSDLARPEIHHDHDQAQETGKVFDETSKSIAHVRPRSPAYNGRDEAEVKAAFEELVTILKSDNPIQQLNKLILALINMMDVGGQSEFLDMLPALTMGRALYLLFFPLHDDLYRLRDQIFRDSSGPIQLNKQYRNIDVLHQALASIACFSGEDQSCALLFGTFSDEVTDDAIVKMEKEIEKEIFDTKLMKFIGRWEGNEPFTTKPFKPVNNKTGTEESEMSYIRSCIHKKISEVFSDIPVPASWIMFRTMLQMMKKRIVSLSQCECIASLLKITDDVKNVLWFFHRKVGSLLYYDKEVEDMEETVICTPEVIFDSMTKLIINYFKNNSTSIDKDVLKEFRSKGIFRLSDIKVTNTDDLLTLQQLVNVLKHHNLLAEVKYNPVDHISCRPSQSQHSNASGVPDETSRYIIPAVLKYASEEELKFPPSSEVVPLIIQFKTGFVPFGVFCALEAQLIFRLQSLSPKWELGGTDIKKNRIDFTIDRSFRVILTSRLKHFEVCVLKEPSTRSRYTLQDICTTVRQTVTEILEIVISNMKYRPLKEFDVKVSPAGRPFNLAFKCTRATCSNGDHLMIVKSCNEALCKGSDQSQNIRVDLQEEQFVWFNKVRLIKINYTLRNLIR